MHNKPKLSFVAGPKIGCGMFTGLVVMGDDKVGDTCTFFCNAFMNEEFVSHFVSNTVVSARSNSR